MLRDFYEEVDNVEIVFVSSDRSPEDMLSYMKESHGDWLATEHGSTLANDLKQKFGIQGIPTLVVVKPDGSLVTKDGRAHVCSKQPKQAVEGWKNWMTRQPLLILHIFDLYHFKISYSVLSINTNKCLDYIEFDLKSTFNHLRNKIKSCSTGHLCLYDFFEFHSFVNNNW